MFILYSHMKANTESGIYTYFLHATLRAVALFSKKEWGSLQGEEWGREGGPLKA